MRHMEGLSQRVNRPQTGYAAAESARAVGTGAAVALSALYDPTMLVAGGSLTTTFRALFGSDAGKRYLLAASELKPSDPNMARLWQSAQRFGLRMSQGLATGNMPDDD
jgi:hypothetical protein